MPINATFRSGVHSTTGATSYATTASFTPQHNSLMVAFVMSRNDNNSATSVSGNGVTYTKVTGLASGTGGQHDLWVGESGTSPSAGVVTASGWGVNRTGCNIIVVEVTGADLAGGASAAIVQSPTATFTAATSGSITLSAAANSLNRAIAAFHHNADEVTAERTNWTELGDGSFATPINALEVQWRSDTFETTASATWVSTVNGTGIAAEIKAAPIQFDATSNSGYQTAQSTYSWSHTCTGSNRYLRVGVSMLSVVGSSVSGITYGGVALTLVRARASAIGAVRAELWELIAPATGANTIAVTLSAGLDSAAGAISYTGVHQTTASEGAADNSATNSISASDATVNVTTVAANDIVSDVVATDDTTITVGANQTSRYNVTGTLGSGAGSDEEAKPSAQTATMSWTGVGGAATWTIVAAAIRPYTASGTTAVKDIIGVGVVPFLRS